MFWNRKSLFSVTNVNDLYSETVNDLALALGKKSKSLFRGKHEKRLFLLTFDGDVMATQAKDLAQEVTSIIYNVKPGDEVLLELTSPGGAAHAYGYASTQIARLKDAKIPVTVAINLIAASGGYMMACVADKIIAAPYAIVGSIGVVSEFPNFHHLLKGLGVHYKQYTAGKFKRTVSPMGEITTEGEAKFKEDLQNMYNLFKDHVSKYRPKLNIEQVSTGEHWQGLKALELNLIDEIKTSEQFILEKINNFEIIKIKYVGEQQPIWNKFGINLLNTLYNFIISKSNNFI